jgi:hypothetical protein
MPSNYVKTWPNFLSLKRAGFVIHNFSSGGREIISWLGYRAFGRAFSLCRGDISKYLSLAHLFYPAHLSPHQPSCSLTNEEKMNGILYVE